MNHIPTSTDSTVTADTQGSDTVTPADNSARLFQLKSSLDEQSSALPCLESIKCDLTEHIKDGQCNAMHQVHCAFEELLHKSSRSTAHGVEGLHYCHDLVSRHYNKLMDMKGRRPEIRGEVKRLMFATEQAKASQDAELIAGVVGKAKKWIPKAGREVEDYVMHVGELDRPNSNAESPAPVL